MADLSSDELLVAQILIQLPSLFLRSHFALGLPPAWPHHRKRSALQSPPPQPPPSKKPNVSSPDSPLVLNSLPLSPDHNPIAKRPRSNNHPSLDKKSQYVEAIDDLTRQNQGLKGEFEALNQHFNNLKSINNDLKSIKQEMVLCHNKNEIGTSSSSIVDFTGESSNRNEFQPAMMSYHQMGEQSNMNSQNFQIPFGAIQFYDPSIGPKGIPDLNIAIEETFQKNYARILAAQARKNRIQICKNKNNGAAK